MSPQIAPVLKRNCRPAELARSLTVALKKNAKGDREALNLTTPSVEYYRLLSDGLNGVLLRPDKISHHEAKRDRLVDLLLSEVRREEWRSEVRGRTRAMQRRFNVGVLEAISPTKSIHAWGSPREMIARPPMSQIESKTIERGGFRKFVGHL